MAEHEAVAAAVIDGDPHRARQAMEDLIVLTQSHIEHVLAEPDDRRPHLAEQDERTEKWNRLRR
jgi:DNA-binding GntR family transcriptional regulator